MLLLALDTSSPRGSIALAKQDDKQNPVILSERHWHREKSHSELVTVTLQSALEEAAAKLSDLDGILVGTGPGSFTGIRVGVTLARTLGFSLDRPVWSTNSLRLWAQKELEEKHPTLVVMNGFRDIVYAAVYKSAAKSGPAQEILSPIAAQVSELPDLLPPGPLTVVGDGWEKFKADWPPELLKRVRLAQPSFPEAHDLFSIFVESGDSLSTSLWKSVKPLYIRGSEAEEKLRRGLLKPLPTRIT